MRLVASPHIQMLRYWGPGGIAPRRSPPQCPRSLNLAKLSEKNGLKLVGYSCISKNYVRIPPLRDNISSYFLKLGLPFIENSLAFMFNTSIETSIFPDSWKIARVTPIYKNGDRADKSNYRPIYQSYLSFQGSLKNL